MRDDNVGAVHLTVLSAMPGRLRLQLEKPIEGRSDFPEHSRAAKLPV